MFDKLVFKFNKIPTSSFGKCTNLSKTKCINKFELEFDLPPTPHPNPFPTISHSAQADFLTVRLSQEGLSGEIVKSVNIEILTVFKSGNETWLCWQGTIYSGCAGIWYMWLLRYCQECWLKGTWGWWMGQVVAAEKACGPTVGQRTAGKVRAWMTSKQDTFLLPRSPAQRLAYVS